MSKPDEKKLEKIVQILKQHPDGLWVREIARQTDLDKSLVSRYLREHLKEEVEYPITNPIKLVKLK